MLRTMFSSRLFTALFIIAGMSRLAAAELPEMRHSAPELDREFGIMTQVLEESLNRSSLQDWRWVGGSSSPFDRPIRHRYVPTVGVVFTIPVSFTLIDHSADAKTDSASKTSERRDDLWEELSNGERPTSAFGPRADGSPATVDQNSEYLADLTRKSQELEIARHAGNADGIEAAQQMEMVKAALEAARKITEQALTPLLSFAPPRAAEPYDESKLREFRGVVMGVLAKYGHRLEHLPTSEKIIIMAETPAHPAQAIFRLDDLNSFYLNPNDSRLNLTFEALPQPPQAIPPGQNQGPPRGRGPRGGNNRNQGTAQPQGDFNDNFQPVRRNQGGQRRGQGRFVDPAFENDRYLISVKKSEVNKEVAPDVLSGKVEEFRY